MVRDVVDEHVVRWMIVSVKSRKEGSARRDPCHATLMYNAYLLADASLDHRAGIRCYTGPQVGALLGDSTGSAPGQALTDCRRARRRP